LISSCIRNHSSSNQSVTSLYNLKGLNSITFHHKYRASSCDWNMTSHDLTHIYIYDKLRSAFGFKSASTPQINIHWHHYLKSRSNLRIFWNLCPFQILRSMVRVRAYVSDVIRRRFEKVTNGHRFENLKKYIDLRIWKKDTDLRYRSLWHRNQTWIWGLDVD